MAIGNNSLRGIKWSRDRLRHVTLKSHTRDPNTLRAQSREQMLLYLATVDNNETLDIRETQHLIVLKLV